MSEDNKKDSSIEEQVIRVSNNFESDILRLIKTQSMIKTSGSILDEEIAYLNSKTDQVKEKLNELNLKTNELSDLLKVSFEDKDLSSTHVGLYVNEFIASIAKENEEIDSLKKELSDRLVNGSEKLKSLHQFYIAELEAFQQEVDSGLSNIHEDIKKQVDEQLAPAVEEQPPEELKEDLPPETTETIVEPEAPSLEVVKEPETEDNETIENEEEYYQKMFASSSPQNGNQPADDKFLYIALGFLLLCAAGFIGYYLKYIKPNTAGEMVILEELYTENGTEEKTSDAVSGTADTTDADKVDDKAIRTASLPLKGNSPGPEEYISSEKGTLSGAKEFNHTIRVKRANMRSGPGKNYGVVTVVTYGTSVAMLDEQSGIWTKIALPDGKEGWVAKKLLSK